MKNQIIARSASADIIAQAYFLRHGWEGITRREKIGSGRVVFDNLPMRAEDIRAAILSECDVMVIKAELLLNTDSD